MALLILIFIAVFLGLSNGRRAAAKGYPRGIWIFLSVLAFMILYIIAGAVTMMIVLRKEFAAGPTALMEAVQAYQQNITWTTSLLWFVVGYGGYLLIRYIIERMPDNRSRQGEI